MAVDFEKLAKELDEQAQVHLLNYHRAQAAALSYRDAGKRVAEAATATPEPSESRAG